MTLSDRVLYRALVTRISGRLPQHLLERETFGEFEAAPNAVDRSGYVVVLDVSAYYVYVDHDLLAQELIAQTGDGSAIDVLVDFLGNVMGRRVGLPQVSPVSDVLGDTHLDVVRRTLVRRGYQVTRYADDFRILTSTLGDARAALEECAAELYRLGLVLNEDKTRILTSENYALWAARFRDAERQMFLGDDPDTPADGDAIAQFFSSTSIYGSADTPYTKRFQTPTKRTPCRTPRSPFFYTRRTAEQKTKLLSTRRPVQIANRAN
ncbi:RNA-directed DNA polymerase [Rhodococcus sp. P1Y]|uniref:reverse transcriptase domain-containing protein n=1 Tax=Rhodococcus sp. P1Y TaxID=1302308 RepID=UPI001293312B